MRINYGWLRETADRLKSGEGKNMIIEFLNLYGNSSLNALTTTNDCFTFFTLNYRGHTSSFHKKEFDMKLKEGVICSNYYNNE